MGGVALPSNVPPTFSVNDVTGSPPIVAAMVVYVCRPAGSKCEPLKAAPSPWQNKKNVTVVMHREQGGRHNCMYRVRNQTVQL